MSDTEEEWRPWRDGTYEVSNLGNIRRAKPGISTFVGRPVRPIISAGGYAQVQAMSDGQKIRAYVHRMVAEVFHGPCPDGHVVNHMDAVKSNNEASNLEYVTSKQNAAHALIMSPRRRGPRKPRPPLKGGPQRGDAHWMKRHPDRIFRGSMFPNAKLSDSQVMDIRHLIFLQRRYLA